VNHFVWYNLVPLIRSNVEVTVIDQMTQVDITQEYVNNESVEIEASYMFPLDERAAVCGFEAEIQGKRVIGIAKEKEQAQREYNAAIARGDGAYLLEEKKADIFKVKVGNIPPGQQVKIKITYVAEMKSELSDLKKRFLLPSVVAPRYTPPPNWQSSPSDREFEQPMTGAGKGYHLSINMSLYMMSDIVSIESPTHIISRTINGRTGSVGFSNGSEQMDKDLIVNIEVSQPHEPRVCLELNEKGELAAMVTLFPQFQFRDVPCEIIFVVDQSGSMGGSRIQHAREVLQLFMRSLPEDCYFNIVGFGSNHRMLFPNGSVKYNDSSLWQATEHIKKIDANMGGTELLRPLRAVFQSQPIQGYPRQIFVITDGQVSNTDEVIRVVEENNRFNRLFSLGLGHDVSHHLVEGIARAGKGTAQFVTNAEDMAAKVMKQLKEAIQPALNNVKVDWGGRTEGSSSSSVSSTPPPPSGAIVMSLLGYVSPAASAPPQPKVVVRQAPYVVPPVFDSHHFLIYAMYSENKPPSTVKITAQSPDGPLVVELPVDVSKTIHGKLIHTLAARAMIRDLEEGRSWMTKELGYGADSPNVRAEVVRLGTQYQLASKYTSFVAIEERTGQRWDCYFDHYHPQPVPVNVPQSGYQKPTIPVVHYHHAKSMRSAPMAMAAPMSATSISSGTYCYVPEDKSEKKRKSSSKGRARQASFDEAEDCDASFTYAPDCLSHQTESLSFAHTSAPPPAPQSNSFLSMFGFGGASSACPPPPPASSMAMANDYAMPMPMPGMQPSCLPPSAPSVSAPRPSLSDISMTQSVNGSFALTDELVRLLGVQKAVLTDILSNLKLNSAAGIEKEKVIATAAVIVFVEKHYSSQQVVWDRFIGKARNYLQNQLNGKGVEGVEDVLRSLAIVI